MPALLPRITEELRWEGAGGDDLSKLGQQEQLGHIRQHLGEGSTVLRDPELLVDLPLGVKIPVLRGSKPVYCRAKLGEKVKAAGKGRKVLTFYGVPIIRTSPCGHLRYGAREGVRPCCSLLPLSHSGTLFLQLQRPSGFYDLGDPYCRLLRTEYNSLHDPYLQEYHNRKDNLQRLQRKGLVTSEGRVVCTLKEFNEYRQYLTTLKLRAQQVSRQEEERLRQHLTKLKDAPKPPGAINTSHLAQPPLQARSPACPPPPKSSRISLISGRCSRAESDLEEGHTFPQHEQGQEGAKLPRRVSSDADSDTSLDSTLSVRTRSRCIVDSVLQRICQRGPALSPEPSSGRGVTKPDTPRDPKQCCPAKDALSSMGPQWSRQPIPPAGPKPPAQTGARRRSLRVKPVGGEPQPPASERRAFVGRLVDDVLRRCAAREV
ncbi:uncharacterized protein LOC141738341 [Larus michahellis]|uniref:uncharacterized protein LOC141738341 n=1 Tax=Larus michahellis TaxID=119627 RepID=UPI003D9BCB02